jgi:hypothetical protein
MIIRTARGIEMLVVILVGFILGPILGIMVLSMLEMDNDINKHRFILPMMIGGAAAGMWLFLRLYGNAESIMQFIPATRERVKVITNHRLLGLSPRFWAMTLTVLCALSVVFFVSVIPVDPSRMPSGTATAKGTAAFQEANEQLTGVSQGQAHGNTAEAKELAVAFSDALLKFRKIGIEPSNRSSTFSLTKGYFLTYCLLTEQHCIFMVHVPELKNYSENAKSLIADVGWGAAMKLMQATHHRPGTVAVGMRGAFQYDRVIIGRGETAEGKGGVVERTLHGDTDCRTELAVQFGAALKPDQSAEKESRQTAADPVMESKNQQPSSRE